MCKMFNETFELVTNYFWNTRAYFQTKKMPDRLACCAALALFSEITGLNQTELNLVIKIYYLICWVMENASEKLAFYKQSQTVKKLKSKNLN